MRLALSKLEIDAFEGTTRNLSKSKTQDLSEFIAENFGANATYVEGLLARWRSDPALVDESWRAYFEELLGRDGAGASPSDGRTTTLPQADGSGAMAKADGHRDGTGVAPAKTAAAKPPATPTT